MGLNTNLNIAPYNDDFESSAKQKQYIRVLFKPARAVQARELTQLQSILQNQIERFGDNIFQEGTIIEGVNPTVDKTVNFVKLNDQSKLDNLTVYASTDDVSYFVTGQSSGLKAKILAGANGFQTDAPNLKTLFVKYLESKPVATPDGEIDVKQFEKGELLSLSKQEGNNPEEFVVILTAFDGDEHAGQSLAVRVSDGVVYQHGHFNFVNPQLIIASKYNITPADISVGFDINETIVDSALDQTLLDNAQGFNNLNAPGADRLKLEPKLSVYNTATRPESFFALLRIEEGETVFVRGDTQFNSVAKEVAKRTQDESGSYVVEGLDVTTEKKDDKFYAVIGAGKAYAFGYGINNVGKTRLEIEPSTATAIKEQQSTGVSYGGFVEVSTAGGVGLNAVEAFSFSDLSGGAVRYKLYKSDNTEVGSCFVRNIEPVAGNKLKLYLYGVEKLDGQETATVDKIGDSSTKTSLITNKIVEANDAVAVFNTGRGGMKSATNVTYTKKTRKYFEQGQATTSPIVIQQETNGSVSETPVVSSLPGNGCFGISTTGRYVEATSATLTTVGSAPAVPAVSMVFPDNDVNGNPITLEYVYYDVKVTGQTQDTLALADIWVQTTFTKNTTTNFGSLGLPNVISVTQILDSDDVDVTANFTLKTNQRDSYYGLSYLELKAGKSINGATEQIKVRFKALQRTGSGGYLTPNSYAGIDNASELVNAYSGNNGKSYNLLNCFDFRPYANPTVPYVTNNTPGSASTVNITDLVLSTAFSGVTISNNRAIEATQEYYLPRIDKLAIDKSQEFVIIKGQPADNPGVVINDSVFGLADIFIPGDNISKSNINPIKVRRDTTKNYTMKQIERMDKRLSALTDIVSMTVLEMETDNIFIPDGSGNNRFKNGIVVDQFKNIAVADLADSDFNASIERGQTICAPSIKQFPVDLKIDASTATNVTSYDDVTTLSSSSKEQLLSQEYATTFRNLASNFYSYDGNISMFPRFDAEYDVTENPDVTLNIDLETPLLSLVEAIQQFIPLTNSVTTAGEEIQTGVETTAQTIETSFQQTLTTVTESLASSGFNTTQNLGTYLTDFSIKPYMSSKVVKLAVSGLRPNTKHYFYFDQTPVSEHVAPGSVNEADISDRSISPGDIFSVGAKGTDIKSDEYGRLFAVFNIPPQTFFTGDAELIISDSDQYASIESAGTSFARSVYRAYNFAVGKTTIGSDVRGVDFDVQTNTFIEDRFWTVSTPRPPQNHDPLAQTFSVQPAQAGYASYIFTDQIDLWFKKKSPDSRQNGVTVQIREVEQGYPTSKVVPFGEKHVDWGQINVSDTAATPTTVVFDNPVKLEALKDYAIVIKPDANDPDFFIWTAKVGENSITDDSVQISSDWGSGVLFTSTNNKAWQSYQNEDLKFKIYKTPFTTNQGFVDLVPNDCEFFNITSPVGHFQNDEFAYVIPSGATSFNGDMQQDKKIVVSALSDAAFPITIGDLVVVTLNNDTSSKHVSTVKSLTGTNLQPRVITLFDAPDFAQGDSTVQVSIQLGVGGKVTYFNKSNPDTLHIKESTVKQSAQYTTDGTQVITGATSGATANVASIFNAPVSYVQPFIMDQNTLRTSTSLKLFKYTSQFDASANTVGEDVSGTRSNYLTAEQRTIPSKQNTLSDTSGNGLDYFRFRLTLDNNDYKYVTPVIDNTLSTMYAYNYNITDNEQTTSKYVSKKVVLQKDAPALGLKVLLAGFRPTGSTIDVQARFVYPTNPEAYSDWVSLQNLDPELYSSSGNITDYRDFEYNLGTEAGEYDAFQIKIVLKHSESGSGSNVFPHVFDYRAIAIT